MNKIHFSKITILGFASAAAALAVVSTATYRVLHRHPNTACVTYTSNGVVLQPTDPNYPIDKITQLKITGSCPR